MAMSGLLIRKIVLAALGMALFVTSGIST